MNGCMLGSGRLAIGAALTLVTLWTGLVNSFNVERFSGEIGHFLDASERIWTGQVPHLDFVCPYGPLLYYPDALLFKLLGMKWFASQFAISVVHPLVCLALFVVTALFSLSRVRSGFLFFLASWLIGLQTPTFRFWLPLAAVSSLYWSARRFSTGYAAAAAFVCGLSFYMSPEVGIAAVGGAAPLLILQAALKDRTRAWVLGALIVSLLSGLIYPPFFTAYLGDVWGLGRFSNYYAGLPFPALRFSVESFVWYAPPLFAAAAAARLAFLLLRRSDDSKTMERIHTLGISIFALIIFRYALGRSDYRHLLCVLPAFLLLLFRLAKDMPSGRVVLFLAVLPYVSVSVMEGHFYKAADFRLSPRDGYVEFAEEGVWAPGTLVEKVRSVSRYVSENTAGGEPVLFLPLPFHAHFGRRASALPSLLAEQIVISRRSPEWAVGQVDSSGASVFVLDRADCFPGLPGFLPPGGSSPLSGYLSWASPAEEAILRELREYLESSFEPVREVDGAVIFKRRGKPPAAPAMVVVSRIKASREDCRRMARGEAVEFAMPQCPYDEIRIPIRVRYPWGLGSLAKTNLRLEYASKVGAPAEGFIPLPPSALKKDVRFRPSCGYPASLSLSVSKWGALVPPPTGIDFGEILVMRRPSYREIRRAGAR